MDRVAVIGSGLAGVTAAKTLVSMGIKPVVLDWGDTAPGHIEQHINSMMCVEPNAWLSTDRNFMESLLADSVRQPILKKTFFGSDFFYAKEDSFEPTKHKNVLRPPTSLAYGGLANGWGGAVLPVHDCDLVDWPIPLSALAPYYRDVLAQLPFSAAFDSLDSDFPLYAAPLDTLALTQGNKILLDKLRKNAHYLKERGAVFGQARLLTWTHNQEQFQGCKYCGYCMIGCVYDSIYKPDQELNRLLAQGAVDYQSHVFVESLVEEDNTVSVLYRDKTNCFGKLKFSRVFLAAGAIGSPCIILRSKNLYDYPIEILTTNHFVVPLLSKRGYAYEWPNINTQPGLFLEYKIAALSQHWVHAQISTPNELALEKLGLVKKNRSFWRNWKRKFASHLYLAACNMHSDHAVRYQLELTTNNFLQSQVVNHSNAVQAQKVAQKKLALLVKAVDCYALPQVLSVQSFHLGGGLPMRKIPIKPIDTDMQGRPKNWRLVHVIDSSVFPSIPGTTIGLTIMANAMRIVKSSMREEVQ